MWVSSYNPGSGPIQYNVWIPNTASEELSIFQTVFITTFGLNTNIVPSSLNGVFIQELTNFGIQNENTVTLITSQVYNPNYASGQDLDSLCNWNNIKRQSATRSLVTCQLTGQSGTIIPVNTQIISIYNDVFYAQSAITLDSSGNGAGDFLSVNFGSINCDANAVNRILQPISGWDTVNNNDSGIQGELTQTDTSLRFERKYNLGVNSTGSIISLNSNLGNTQNVLDFIVINNDTLTPLISRGVTVPVGSIYISVYAPSIENISTIGNLIANCNSSGTPIYTTGTNTQTYTYTDSQYFFTIPTTWDEPNPCPIQVDISYVNNPLLPANIEEQITNLIINNFNNGSTAFAAVNMRQEFYVAQLTSGVENLGVIILSQTMQTVTSGTPSQSLFLNVVGTIGTTGKPTINSANINLTAA
jgi:hypothetical protein